MPQSGYPDESEDPEPSGRFPAGPLFVPVRPGPTGCAARLFRTRLGARTVVGFTSERRLTATLGAAQAWVRLGEQALRSLGEPLGVTVLTVNPQLAAPAVTPPGKTAPPRPRPLSPSRAHPHPTPAPSGTPRGNGTAAVGPVPAARIG
ncbi:SAV_915 family protein [Streptomyces sp. H27-D2]|uniref:SAV_915 family protein n=1 Tax=Streptomyces sp. H27-D2 TaxID=3046304 RepID=UPI002DB955E4|nr:SAV_915 family protein [Streptomyces sp. H27-D2]MEC4020629.1 SAV_915 family protein [Streptomyces sp. H27-D2]